MSLTTVEQWREEERTWIERRIWTRVDQMVESSDADPLPAAIIAVGAEIVEALAAPRPGRGLTHASARHLSPYGPVECAWRLEGSEMLLTVSLPTGTSGQVELSDGTSVAVGPGTHSFVTAMPELRPA